MSLLGAWLNRIPLACLAAVLFVTGVKLASPTLVRQMWAKGGHQFAPFLVTVAGVVLTDLLVGVLAGLAAAAAFVLWTSARRPVRQVVETHVGGRVVRVELADQVSFLNRAALARVLDGVPAGGHVLLDARATYYIDPDVLDLLRDFAAVTGPAWGVEVSLLGFRVKYQRADDIQYVDSSTRAVQDRLTPEQVLRILADGNERFRTGRRLTRDHGWGEAGPAAGQHPLAVVVGCIDSRAPAELVFDLGVGDVLSARAAGNVAAPAVVGSVEYGCAVAGAKLMLVMGHTRCGAVSAAVERAGMPQATAGQPPEDIIREIQTSIGQPTLPPDRESFVRAVAVRNVCRTDGRLRRESPAPDRLVRAGQVRVVGAMYDLDSRTVEFLADDPPGLLGPA